MYARRPDTPEHTRVHILQSSYPRRGNGAAVTAAGQVLSTSGSRGDHLISSRQHMNTNDLAASDSRAIGIGGRAFRKNKPDGGGSDFSEVLLSTPA